MALTAGLNPNGIISVTLSLLLLGLVAPLSAQEVKFIDLASLEQRTALRHPPAPPPSCENDTPCGIGPGSGGGSGSDGAPDLRDPRALGVYLLRVTPTEIDPVAPFEAEFEVRNTGSVPIRLPVWPHLSDLQPADDSLTFSYFSLALVADGNNGPEGPVTRTLGFVELYGSSELAESFLALRPGEWIRVRANIKLRSWPAEATSVDLRGSFWLRRNTFRPQPGGQFTEVQNLYPNVTATPPITIHFMRSTSPAR